MTWPRPVFILASVAVTWPPPFRDRTGMRGAGRISRRTAGDPTSDISASSESSLVPGGEGEAELTLQLDQSSENVPQDCWRLNTDPAKTARCSRKFGKVENNFFWNNRKRSRQVRPHSLANRSLARWPPPPRLLVQSCAFRKPEHVGDPVRVIRPASTGGDEWWVVLRPLCSSLFLHPSRSQPDLMNFSSLSTPLLFFFHLSILRNR